MNGCIGAADGWVVKIRCPSWKEVLNPGKYFCRKGFYGINVQAIVAKNKKILWRSIGEKGSAHDSKVFIESSLGKLYERLVYCGRLSLFTQVLNKIKLNSSQL